MAYSDSKHSGDESNHDLDLVLSPEIHRNSVSIRDAALPTEEDLLQYEKENHESYKSYIKNLHDEADKIYNEHMNNRFPKKDVSSRIKDKRSRFITLSCTTDWSKLRQSLSKILCTRSNSIEQAYGCVESTKKQRPHVHMIVYLQEGKYIRKPILQRQNNNDIVDIRIPRKDENVLSYIAKDDTKWEFPDNSPYFKFENNTISWHSVPQRPD